MVTAAKEDERAIKRLVKFYTRRRQWSMVRALLCDLGRIWGDA